MIMHQAKEIWTDSTDTSMHSKTLGYKIGLFDSIYTRVHSQTPPTRTLEWLTSDNKWQFDVDFLYTIIGDRYGSPLLNSILEDKNIPASARVGCAKNIITNLILDKFYEKWTRLWDAYTAEYEILDNYNGVEVRTPALYSDSETKTKTNLTQTTENKAYGFNSSTEQPVSKIINSTDGNDTNNKVSTHIGQTGTETIEKHGNLGVTTSQQMLWSEVELRDKWIFIQNTIYNDIASVILIDIY